MVSARQGAITRYSIPTHIQRENFRNEKKYRRKDFDSNRSTAAANHRIGKNITINSNSAESSRNAQSSKSAKTSKNANSTMSEKNDDKTTQSKIVNDDMSVSIGKSKGKVQKRPIGTIGYTFYKHFNVGWFADEDIDIRK
jgi:hypothetical protein